MQIEKYIKKFRLHLLYQHFFTHIIWILVITTLTFIAMVQLESVFYFDPKIKKAILIGSSVIFLLITIYWVIYFYWANNNNIHRYNVESLASKLGSNIFSDKHDTVLNALQLETSADQNESRILAQTYIKNVKEKLNSIDLNISFNNDESTRLKILLLATWVFAILIFFLSYDLSANSFYRWTNPTKHFAAPKPFSLMSMSGDIHIIGGDNTEINIQANPSFPDTVHLHLTPNQVSTKKRDSLKLKFSATPIDDGTYHFKLPELYQDYSYQAFVKANHFWEAWESVATKPFTIFVTDRPIFESFSLTIIPPKYSKLEKVQQEGNIALIKGLKGSIIQIDLTSNRMLKNAYVEINGERSKMASNYNQASGYFKLMDEGQFTVNLVDKRGITNRDPIPYKLQIIPDHYPTLSILKPSPITELGNDQSVPIHLEISDDYGFTDLQLAYEVQRPAYLQADPYVAMFNINDLSIDSLDQTIKMFWDLNDMMLMPEDEVHFHFELTDNDIISGPKRTVSSTFIVRVPSLADLYENVESSEKDFIDDVISDIQEIEDLKEQFEKMELEVLKSKELDWDQEQSLKNSIEKSKEEIENLEKIADALENITDQADKHKLFSPDLLDKFKELSELISEIIPEDLLENMDDLQNALENMDMSSLQEALSDLSENMAQIENDLDRYLEIFKKFQAEQKLDEIQNRMQQLIEQQQALDQEINRTQDIDDVSALERLAQEEERNLDEFENITSLMEEAAEAIEPFSETSSNELSELSDSELSQDLENSLGETIESLSQQNIADANNASQESLNNMEMMIQQMMNIQQGFSQETVSEMMEKFQGLMQDMLYLSSEEEKLRNDVKQSSRNSPRLRELASRQQLLQDQLQSITRQMMELSNETFAITPEIGRGIGKANAGMEEAKTKLTERNLNQAGKNQDVAMEGLNEATLGLFNSMQSMQESGSASGYEQFLKSMQQMAGQQQGINQQGMQLGLGQMAAAAQQQMMQQMLSKQKGIRKSLEQLMNEMRHSGQKGMGDLSGIAGDMDEVIKDLQKKRFNRKTKERQQRILSRMLDSQTSMTQRGKKDDRKSSTAVSDLVLEGPGGLPSDMGQRENLALQALNNAMNAGYSREHQTMIKRYFNSLSKISQETQIKDNNEVLSD